ncbi:NUDIX hydrolase [Rhizobium sp. KVB221]|uniref:NUDIX hydrolase n=1 Tax=Rhizobium setariae TaxID=2801340 RepID=A0A936YTF6_9HYPH|nr:NUDIX hydrolase [Rhizobium setariae]MBL0375543.1 NUDIX hydrolase [Rhizobium setariae]
MPTPWNKPVARELRLKDRVDFISQILDINTVQQSAAICYRLGETGNEVLLVKSRDSGRWVLPKGNIDKHESARMAASRESMVEAGVTGQVEKEPFGFYSYLKTPDETVCMVRVFLLKATGFRKRLAEAKQRRSEWVSAVEASRRVSESELRNLLRRFARLPAYASTRREDSKPGKAISADDTAHSRRISFLNSSAASAMARK